MNSQTQSSTNSANHEELLLGVFNSFVTGIQVLDPIYNSLKEIIDFKWLLVNDAVLKTWGKSREEVMSKTMLELFPGVKKENLFAVYIQAANGEAFNFKQYYNNGGLDHWFNINLVPFRSGFILSSIDITNEVKAEEALKQNNAALEENVRKRTQQLKEQRDQIYSVLMQAPAMIAIGRGRELIFELANPLYLQFVGRGSDIIGKPLLDVFPEIKGQPIHQILMDVLDKGERFVGNELLIPLANSEGIMQDRYFNFVYEPLRNPNGKVDGLITHAVDVTDQVVAKNKVQQSEKRLQLAQQVAGIGTFEWDLKTNKAEFTSQVEEIFGYKADGWKGNYHNALAHIHPNDQEMIMREHQRAIANKQNVDITLRIILEDGTARWLNSKAEPLWNEDGQPEKMIGVIQDITERKKYEQALKNSEEQLRAIFNQTSVGIAEVDLSGNFLLANQAYCNMVGRTSEELYRMSLYDITPPEDHNREALKKLAMTGKGFTFEKRYIKSDGTIIWANLDVAGIKDITGKVKYILAVTHEITDLKLYEQTLKESEERFKNLADTAPIYIAMADETGNAVYFNKPWIDWTGKKLEELLGLGWLCTLHPDDAPKFERDFKNAFEKRIPISEQYRFLRADGEYRWMLAVGAPRFTKDGRFLGYFGTYTDFHELQQAQEALERSQAELKLLMQKKDEFLAVASHELKTPLTTVKASLQLLQRLMNDEVNPMVDANIERAVRQVEKLRLLVSDLLDVSKIHAGKLQLNFEPFTIEEIMEDCVSFTKTESNHEVIVKGDISLSIIADKNRVEQALCNLLSNAVKYSPEANQVEIAITSENNFVKISVRDFGIGIPQDKIPFIFDRFFRVSDNSIRFQGLGLGLYITSEIIKRHSGEIGVQSELGKGTTFYFTLPIKRPMP